MLEWTYRIGLGLIVVMGLMAFATTIRAPNGYGRYLGSKLEGTIAARPGWLIFEAPQWMAFALTFWLTARASNINTATLLLFGLWQAHYLYRGLAMPFLMQIGRKRLPIATIWFGLPFNALNGFVNGYAVGHAEHLASASWLSDPRFVAGLADQRPFGQSAVPAAQARRDRVSRALWRDVSLRLQRQLSRRDHVVDWLGRDDMDRSGADLRAVHDRQPRPARAEPPQMVSRDLRRLPARAKSADPVRALNVIPAKAGIHSRGGCGLIRKASQNGFPPSRE